MNDDANSGGNAPAAAPAAASADAAPPIRRSTRERGAALFAAAVAAQPAHDAAAAAASALRQRTESRRCNCKVYKCAGTIVTRNTKNSHASIDKKRREEEKAAAAAVAAAARVHSHMHAEMEVDEERKGGAEVDGMDWSDGGGGGGDYNNEAEDDMDDSHLPAVLRADPPEEEEKEPVVEVEDGAESSEDDAAAPVEVEPAAPAAEDDAPGPKHAGGRPRLDHSVHLDSLSATGACQTTLRELLTSVLTLADDNNLSQAAADELFQLLQKHMPSDNKIPNRDQATKQLLRASPVTAKHYIVCPNDCQFLRVPIKEDRDSLHARVRLDPPRTVLLDVNNDQDRALLAKLQRDDSKYLYCSKCNRAFHQVQVQDVPDAPVHDEAKAADDRAEKKKKANKKSGKSFLKKFIWFGLTDRLKMMCEDPYLCDVLCLPWPGTSPPPTTDEKDAALVAGAPPLRSPVQPTEADDCMALHQSVGWWESVQEQVGDGWKFGGRNLVLSLNVDGFQPFKRGGVSITPLTVMLLNLPENLRHRAEYMLLAGIIPQRKPKDYNTYLRPLIDELKLLRSEGFEFIHPKTKAVHRVFVKLLFTSCDYPAHCDLNSQHAHNHTYGCIKCELRSLNLFSRPCYDGFAELAAGIPPPLLTHEQYMVYAAEYERIQGDPMYTTDEQRAAAFLDGCKSVNGTSLLTELGPEFDIALNTNLDMMHIVSGWIHGHLLAMLKTDRFSKLVVKEEDMLKARAARELKAEADEEASKKAQAEKDDKEVQRGKYVSSAQQAKQVKARREEENRKEAEAAKKEVAEKKKRVEEDASVKLVKFVKRYGTLNPAAIQRMEDAYRHILAPSNIAPHSKSPIRLSGDMTAHHWVNFAKVYGKYLFYAQYGVPDGLPPKPPGPEASNADIDKANKKLDAAKKKNAAAERENPTALAALCAMMDLMELCLRSHVTAKVKEDTRVLVQVLAANFNRWFPITEQALVVHSLLFHIPSTIRRWGPARGFWCFPFERFIGHLSNKIKSRKHPEMNLANRYLLSIATRNNQHVQQYQAEMEEADEDGAEARASHPLIPLTAVHSLIDPQQVFWPTRTKYNCRVDHQDGLNVTQIRQRLLVPMLGSTVTEEYAGMNNTYRLFRFRHGIQVGRWRYGVKQDRPDALNRKSCSCWFQMLAKDLPHFDLLVQGRVAIAGDELVYGRILAFKELHLPNWREEPFQLAEVDLYAGNVHHPIMGYPQICISSKGRLCYRQKIGAEEVRSPITHIQAKDLKGCVAVAPNLSRVLVTKDNVQQQRYSKDSFFVLPLSI